MSFDKYRHEYKYFIYQSQQKFLENQAKAIMRIDDNAINGLYNIRSLYFDDIYNSCFYDNENGNDPREKYRIRIYNHSSNKISLECKRKQNGKTLKTATSLSEEQCLKLMAGQVVDNYMNSDELVKKLCVKMLTDGFRPATIIEYDRIPFVNMAGNVRVTFDTNISSSNYFDLFLDDKMPKRAIMPTGMNLLEVKFDEFLPDVIYNQMQLDTLSITNCSKFYLGRCYELGKNIFKK